MMCPALAERVRPSCEVALMAEKPVLRQVLCGLMRKRKSGLDWPGGRPRGRWATRGAPGEVKMSWGVGHGAQSGGGNKERHKGS